MAKFKVGDKVTIVRLSERFVTAMERFVGKDFFVKKYDGGKLFLCDAEGRNYSCEEFMIDGYLSYTVVLVGPYAMHHMIAREICGEFDEQI